MAALFAYSAKRAISSADFSLTIRISLSDLSKFLEYP
nr:MAG TPA: hypothetical protein [Caudoviricetes sp.]DAP43446.1 MAG TPA: hypothetical protein [Caudoviricetes sp.]DAR80402.1 MAG TPA: hypothetical protein [Caudoviricetes sp.]